MLGVLTSAVRICGVDGWWGGRHIVIRQAKRQVRGVQESTDMVRCSLSKRLNMFNSAIESFTRVADSNALYYNYTDIKHFLKIGPPFPPCLHGISRFRVTF